jgi:hypothetical protein
MADVVKPLVYLVLGAAGSGRREVLADLIEGGLSETDRAAVLLADSEGTDETAEKKLGMVARWRWLDQGAIEGELPVGATQVFFVADGRRNPVEQAEVFKPWVEAQGGEIARVLCVVNCQLAEKNPALLAWFEACVHFSDVVLLNKREGVQNKWLSDFQARFTSQFLPCLFDFVKNGRVKNPALILDPLARRMTHAFDAEQDWIFTDSEGEVIEEDEVTDDDEEEIEATPEVDPYFVRDAANRRLKKIPDITKFL